MSHETFDASCESHLEVPEISDKIEFSASQLQQLAQGPGLVRNPVELKQPTTIHELAGFPLRFINNQDTMAWRSFGNLPCVLRFRTLYPEVAEYIGDNIEDFLFQYEVDTDARGPFIMQAYKLMANLVHADDIGVKFPDGTIDKAYLTR